MIKSYLQPFLRNRALFTFLLALPFFGNLRAEICADDAFNPCCGVPHDVTYACADLPYNFNPYNILQLKQLFGAAMTNSYCQGYYYTELTPIVNLNNCTIGTITRRFEAYNPAGGWGQTNTLICTQTVTIAATHNYEIRFPKDEIAYCTEPSPDNILYNELACDLLAVSVSDVNFAISGTACYKIFRTYRVLNWCEYDGMSQPIVIGRDEDCDNNPGDEAVWVLRRPNNVAYIDRTNNQSDNNPPFSELEALCGHSGVPGYWRSISQAYGSPDYNRRGFWQYTQHIKVADDIKPVIDFDAPAPFCSLSSNIAAGCPGAVDIPFTVTENCSNVVTIKVFLFAFNQPVALTPANNIAAQVLSGTYPNYKLHGSYPLGNHSFEVHVTDGCGNTNSILIPFKVVDCKAPSPICINGLSTRLMQLEPNTDADGDGVVDVAAMAIWATDFIASPISDCTGPIRYSISRLNEPANINQTSIVLTCEDESPVAVKIYAWDSANNPYAVQPNGSTGGPNYSHCVTYITLLDAQNAPCPAPPLSPVNLSGSIASALDSTITSVTMLLSGGASDTLLNAEDGSYAFSNLAPALDYTITPERDGDDREGISIMDVLTLNRHLMGVQLFTSPYQYIAADMDDSGLVDTADLSTLRRLLMMEDTVIVNNTSWRFVDASYVFADTVNPLSAPFAESITLDSVIADHSNLDFIAIKIGDVNFSAIPQFHSGSLEQRSTLPGIAMQTQGIDLQAGETKSIALVLPENSTLGACQFTLEIDEAALELLDLKATNAQLDYLRHRGGVFTVTAHGAHLEQLVLTLRAKQALNISEHIRLTSSKLEATAFRTSGEAAPLDLIFLPSDPLAGDVLLHANKPNPFRDQTVLAFTLPEATQASLFIQDMSGRVLKRIEGTYEKGYHEVILHAKELDAVGVLMYTLQTPRATKTAKMVVLKR